VPLEGPKPTVFAVSQIEGGVEELGRKVAVAGHDEASKLAKEGFLAVCNVMRNRIHGKAIAEACKKEGQSKAPGDVMADVNSLSTKVTGDVVDSHQLQSVEQVFLMREGIYASVTGYFIGYQEGSPCLQTKLMLPATWCLPNW